MKPNDTSQTMVRESASARDAATLTGRLAEYGELCDTLAERPGLTILSADPWSGTSALLREALGQLDGPFVLVDARVSADVSDLATAVADAAVEALAGDAFAWWSGSAPPASAAGLRLMRTLREREIDSEEIRAGNGPGLERLADAIELMLALVDGPVTLAIDHAGLLLAALADREARMLLGLLRSLRQAHPTFDLLLVEHPGGVAGAALANADHPLFRAGQRLRFRRPTPARFRQDLVITRPWTRVPVDGLVAAAELAAGVPELTWQVIEFGSHDESDASTRALKGWQCVRRLTRSSTGRQWDSLRRIHPLAQAVVAAVGCGLPPHAVAGNSKSINDALHRLRGLGMAWQPAPRAWALADPLLAAWTRDHPPPWVARRRRASA